MSGWSDGTFESLALLATRRAGLAFSPSRIPAAEAGMVRAMRRSSVASARQYLERLASGALPIDDLIAELTVGETYFFRQRDHFALIARDILPEILQRRGQAHTVRIWSAGCSSGEEPYSLAITLTDAGVIGEVLGTDVSEAALCTARSGVYRTWSLRELDPSDSRRYFVEHDQRWALDARYRTMATFERHNLAADAYPPRQRSAGHFDVILCRNVLMYFDADSLSRVTAGLAESLAEDGWLLTGPFDPPLTDPRLCSASVAGCVVYRRVQRTTAAGEPGPARMRAGEGTPQHAAASTPSRVPGSLAPPPPRSASSSPRADTDALPQVRTAFDAGAYEEAIRLTGGLDSSEETAVIRVHAVANARGTVEALQEVSDQLACYPLSASLHLMRALLLVDTRQFAEARESLRRACYLEPNSQVARVLLQGTSALRFADASGFAPPAFLRRGAPPASAIIDPARTTRADRDALGLWSTTIG